MQSVCSTFKPQGQSVKRLMTAYFLELDKLIFILSYTPAMHILHFLYFYIISCMIFLCLNIDSLKSDTSLK